MTHLGSINLKEFNDISTREYNPILTASSSRMIEPKVVSNFPAVEQKLLDTQKESFGSNGSINRAGSFQNLRETEVLYKVVMVGESGVGKTSILSMFCEGCFRMNHVATIGIDFKIKRLNLDDNTLVKLQIWDTAGQERFMAMTSQYYRGTHGTIMIYDISNKESFDRIANWYQAVRAHVGREAVYFLIGNKIDLPDSDRQVTTIQGEQLAKKLGAQFFEVSVKKKVGVKDLFLNLTHTMHSIFKNELTNQGTEFMNGYGATDRTKFNVNGHNDRKVTINSPKNYNVLDSEDGSWVSCCL